MFVIFPVTVDENLMKWLPKYLQTQSICVYIEIYRVVVDQVTSSDYRVCLQGFCCAFDRNYVSIAQLGNCFHCQIGLLSIL